MICATGMGACSKESDALCLYKTVPRPSFSAPFIRDAHRGAIVDLSLAAVANSTRISRDRETALYRHWHKDDP